MRLKQIMSGSSMAFALHAKKERTTLRFDSSQVQFHTDREGWNPKLREERARARAVEWNDGSRRHAEDALILADK